MEIYNIGAKVQAVDERGRWENGKIVNIREDGAGGQLFTVKFDGWPAMFNQDVDRSGLRNRVSPGAVDDEISQRRRNVVTKNFLGHLRTLGRDDTVEYDGQLATVKTVDRFKRSVRLFASQDGPEVTVHASQLQYVEEPEEEVEPVEPSTSYRPKRKQSGHHKQSRKRVKCRKDELDSDGCEDGSKEGSDYLWGYTETDVENYVLHAESFYQLFTLRYGADKLTPYMMMFIDQAPKLMTILPFPISRYESEAGEHTNYDHSRFTFQHTTRGGGHGKPDTILPLFRRMWKSISHSITSNADKDEESCKAAAKFDELVFQHVAAVEIQRRVRGYLTRKALQRHTKWTPRVSLSKCDDKMRQQQLCQISEALKELGFAEERVPHDELFRHSVFVLCGSVPKTMGKLKQADIEKMIRANGGRVKNSLPTSLKGVSTKKYIVLVDQLFVGAKKKMPLAVRHAIEGNHHVLKFAYVVDSVKEQQVKDKLAYAHDVSSISATMTQRVPLKQHFSRSLGTGASYIKKSRKRKRGQPTHQKKQEGKTKKKEYKSACQLYALRNVEFQGVKKFEERGQWIGFFTKKWTTLSNEEKLPYVTEWNQSRKNDNDKQ